MRNIECCDQNSLIVRNLGFGGLGPGNAQQILAFNLERISSDKASNLPKRDVRFILLK